MAGDGQRHDRIVRAEVDIGDGGGGRGKKDQGHEDEHIRSDRGALCAHL